MKLKKEADRLYSKLEKGKEEEIIYYYKKRKVYPVLNEDGSINYFNLITGGSYTKLIVTLLVIGIIVGFIFEYHNNLQQCADLMSKIQQGNIKINWSQIYEDINIKNFSLGVRT